MGLSKKYKGIILSIDKMMSFCVLIKINLRSRRTRIQWLGFRLLVASSCGGSSSSFSRRKLCSVPKAKRQVHLPPSTTINFGKHHTILLLFIFKVFDLSDSPSFFCFGLVFPVDKFLYCDIIFVFVDSCLNFL